MLSHRHFLNLMDRFLERTNETVQKNSGVFNDFEQDKVTFFFHDNSGDIRGQHAIRACETALDLLQMISEINYSWAELGIQEDLALKVTIGMQSGPCLVGNYGTRERLKFGAVGANVELAQKIATIAKTYNRSILLHHDTKDAVHGAFKCSFVTRADVGLIYELSTKAKTFGRSPEESFRSASEVQSPRRPSGWGLRDHRLSNTDLAGQSPEPQASSPMARTLAEGIQRLKNVPTLLDTARRFKSYKSAARSPSNRQNGHGNGRGLDLAEFGNIGARRISMDPTHHGTTSQGNHNGTDQSDQINSGSARQSRRMGPSRKARSISPPRLIPGASPRRKEMAGRERTTAESPESISEWLHSEASMGENSRLFFASRPEPEV
eukprot:CAMPEP_0184308164 /NCGR_PEP_ID=MMETSP1049-20130417/16691_1 /TAXON_ID=77928 /ORGANISM="Proteomonas sulcata, Strain CCMP704" /LENGTH=378 /DNA_ID=CAMNT_0026620795 /DNA_START=12 /DNA_END=1148 /DNA_ORIENTATION=+